MSKNITASEAEAVREAARQRIAVEIGFAEIELGRPFGRHEEAQPWRLPAGVIPNQQYLGIMQVDLRLVSVSGLVTRSRPSVRRQQ